ncbi:hypothetical protein GCM10022255_110320 [Dactylosporangium darangshiense]|uniref:Uncharacterized protein n=1 Tax=Dactylosporangium darangshiense TaxID=579108 RepID=A0ABP8DUI3_9ACTN
MALATASLSTSKTLASDGKRAVISGIDESKPGAVAGALRYPPAGSGMFSPAGGASEGEAGICAYSRT